jgi:hypothetical protein
VFGTTPLNSWVSGSELENPDVREIQPLLTAELLNYGIGDSVTNTTIGYVPRRGYYSYHPNARSEWIAGALGNTQDITRSRDRIGPHLAEYATSGKRTELHHGAV